MKIYAVIASTIAVLICVGAPSAQHKDTFHHSGNAPKVNYDSLLAAAVPLDDTEAGRKLLDDCIASYGGTDKLEALRDFELTYQVTSKFERDPYKLVKSFQRGRRYRTESPANTRILNGSECWFQNKDTEMELDSGRYRAELFSYLALAMPLGVRTERFDSIRYGERPGDALGYIYCDKADSLLVVLGINRTSHMIETAEGIVRQGDKGFVFVSRFTDYVEHGGYLFAGRVTMTSMGLAVGEAQLDRVRVNPGFDDTVFRP
jgi:hypothetical protein